MLDNSVLYTFYTVVVLCLILVAFSLVYLDNTTLEDLPKAGIPPFKRLRQLKDTNTPWGLFLQMIRGCSFKTQALLI